MERHKHLPTIIHLQKQLALGKQHVTHVVRHEIASQEDSHSIALSTANFAIWHYAKPDI
jgi:hypothetical protein